MDLKDRKLPSPFQRTSSKCTIGREIKLFPKKLENINKRQGNFILCSRLPSAINSRALPRKRSSYASHKLRGKKQMQLEVEDMLRKGTILDCQHREGRFLSSLFRVGKRD